MILIWDIILGVLDMSGHESVLAGLDFRLYAEPVLDLGL